MEQDGAVLCIAFRKKIFIKNSVLIRSICSIDLTASPSVRITAGGAGIAAGEGYSRCMSAPDGSRAQDPPQAMTRRFWAHKNPGQSSRLGGLSGFLYAVIPLPAGQAAPRSAHPPPRPSAAKPSRPSRRTGASRWRASGSAAPRARRRSAARHRGCAGRTRA